MLSAFEILCVSCFMDTKYRYVTVNGQASPFKVQSMSKFTLNIKNLEVGH